MKCNDNPIILKTLATLGTGFDCASKGKFVVRDREFNKKRKNSFKWKMILLLGEIKKVMSYGIAADSIIFANPAKPISHLNFAAKMNVKTMTIDGDFELYKIKNHFPSAR